MSKPVKIEADIMWAFLTEPNEMSGKYQVDLCNLNAEAVKALESLGITVNNKEGKGFYITAKSTREIKASDSKGDPIKVKVANGSKASALVGTYSWTWKNKTGISPSLVDLKITDLIEYNPDAQTEEVL
jgi:hypothetical protein